VRTLHHYDEIGLLNPSARTAAGYRLYSDEDLERLQRILLYREVGFALDEIGDLVDDPSLGRREALLTQRDLIIERATRLDAMGRLIDKTLASMEGGIPMDEREMFEVFDEFDPSEYEDEVKERWGDTEAYVESARRTARYTRQHWERFRTENEAVNAAVAELMDAGVPADDPRAMDAAERARLLIHEWFYPCSRRMHAQLGETYVSDPRFTKTYEDIREGMAEYVRDATAANAARP
jgi:DNA-binding transcriptional MerR regulator